MINETLIPDWITQAQSGDLEAFSNLIRHYEPAVTAFALYRMPNREEAIEAVQDTFVRAHEQLSDFRVDSDFGTWLRSICRYMILSRAKTYSRRKAHDTSYRQQIDLLTTQHLMQTDPDPQVDLLDYLKTCTGELSEKNQALLQSRYTEKLSTREISEQTGRTETWVTSTLHRVRSALRTCIEQKESSHEK